MTQNALQQIRAASELTQEQFAELLGVSRPYLGRVEIGDKPFTYELQKMYATVAGAWINLKNGEPAKKAIPLRWSTFVIESAEQPDELLLKQKEAYSKKHWKEWRSGLYCDPSLKIEGEDDECDLSLRFEGKHDSLLFWLEILLAGSMRAQKAESVRAEIILELASIARRYKLEPTLNTILKSYEPIFSEYETRHESKKVTWKPYSRPPSWLRTAIDLQPLSLHVTKPSKPLKGHGKKLDTITKKLKKGFVRLLKKNPEKAAFYAREKHLPQSSIKLAKDVANWREFDEEMKNK